MEAILEKRRADAERRREVEEEIARDRLDLTHKMLRLIGADYRRHLETEKSPPRADDFRDLAPNWTSARDGEPFVVVWGVDLSRLPAGGTGMLLAWEARGDADGSRCVLLADAKTTRVLTAAEFRDFPRAK